MDRKTRSLMIKSNRVLGTRLVEAGLTSVDNMDKANEAFIRIARTDDLRKASLLRIMIYDHQTISEEQLLDYQLENCAAGAVMLENYNLNQDIYDDIPLELMRASWTLPIDRVGNRWFVATCYYLSDVVRQFWEEKLEGRINWYVTTMSQLEKEFEARAAAEAEEAAQSKAAEQPEKGKA